MRNTRRHGSWNFRSRLLCLFAGLLVIPAGYGLTSTEYQLKAAFLFNFVQFVDWPAGAFDETPSKLVICVLGPDPFGSNLDSIIQGEQVNGRTLTVERHSDASDIRDCHLVYINQNSADRLHQSLTQLKGRPILTVSDLDGFLEQGGMIRFVTEDNKIRLHVNLQATTDAQLHLSSKLLKRSQIVNGGEAR